MCAFSVLRLTASCGRDKMACESMLGTDSAEGEPSGTVGSREGVAARTGGTGSVCSLANGLVVWDIACVDCSVLNLMIPFLVTH